MTEGHLYWANKQIKKIEMIEEDLTHFLGSKNYLQNESCKGIYLENSFKQKVKLLWFEKWSEKTVLVELKYVFEGTGLLNIIEDYLQKERDKQQDIFENLTDEDMKEENCLYKRSSYCNPSHTCIYCENFKLTKLMEDVIAGRTD